MTATTMIKSMTTLTQNFKKLLDQHSTTMIQVLSLCLVGLLLSGFTAVADGPVYASWMYFIAAMLAFAIIAFILFRSTQR